MMGGFLIFPSFFSFTIGGSSVFVALNLSDFKLSTGIFVFFEMLSMGGCFIF
jgi:hypothetical protein